MIKRLIFLIAIFLSFEAMAESIKVSGVDVSYKIRDSQYNRPFNKLSLEIEVSLVNGRLPSKQELQAISNKVLKTQPNANMKWVTFLLPKMKSGHGAYATDHRTPQPEGVKIMEFMLYNTPYQSLIK
jgi:hypothetical protein